MTVLERVVATDSDGRTVTFADGEVTGDADLIDALEMQTGSCTLVVGLNYDASEFREHGNAFVAACLKLGLTIDDSEGTEPVGPGDLLILDPDGNPTPEWVKHEAEYRREMAKWHARRRRLSC
jgi:hypothetical protein